MRIGVVIVCAGESKRLGKTDKITLKLKEKPLFYHSVSTFNKIKEVKQIVLVLKKKNFELAKTFSKNEKVTFVEGGKERKDSVYNGLISLDQDIDYVLIHDGARPFVSEEVIFRILKELKRFPAVICGLKARDTVKLTDKGVVKETLKRDGIFLVQTPQGFKKNLIVQAYNKIRNRESEYKKCGLDDAQIVELMGKKVKVVDGDILNIKITYPEDLLLAKAIMVFR